MGRLTHRTSAIPASHDTLNTINTLNKLLFHPSVLQVDKLVPSTVLKVNRSPVPASDLAFCEGRDPFRFFSPVFLAIPILSTVTLK